MNLEIKDRGRDAYRDAPPGGRRQSPASGSHRTQRAVFPALGFLFCFTPKFMRPNLARATSEEDADPTAVEQPLGVLQPIPTPRSDRTIYLKLLRKNIVLYGVALIGYCLMSKHIHLIAIPHKVDGLHRH
jgi:hypothetical protein